MLQQKLGWTLVLLTLASSANAGVNEWTFNGPDGGSAERVAISPFDNDLQFAATETALFRWDVNTWRWTHALGVAGMVKGIEFVPGTTNTVFVATGSDGVFRSDDGGPFAAANASGAITRRVDHLDAGTDGAVYAEYDRQCDPDNKIACARRRYFSYSQPGVGIARYSCGAKS